LSAWRKALLLEIVNELQQPIQQGPATSGDPDESLPRGSRTERLDSPRLCVFFDNLGAMEDPKILAWKKSESFATCSNPIIYQGFQLVLRWLE